MNLCNIGHNFNYEMEKLIRLFLPFEKIVVFDTETVSERFAVCKLFDNGTQTIADVQLQLDGVFSHSSSVVDTNVGQFSKECQHELGRQLLNCFYEITGYKPDWGILTGVRPAKLFSSYVNSLGFQGATDWFSEKFMVSEDKISLCKETVLSENKIISLSQHNSFSLYVSIPFCPTRCSYCSFVSHSVDKAAGIIDEYIRLLCNELEVTARIAKKLGLKLETVYVGGGTPTTLSADALDKVLCSIDTNFDMNTVREFTVEAGRPDTIDKEKLLTIKRHGVTRISINPQTMSDSVLSAIGRAHTAKQTVEAFTLAREVGFDNINMDLIAGLPTDTLQGFADTLEQVISLNPESVTVHALSMKRASTLTTMGKYGEIESGVQASKMVSLARKRLTECEILPYYMYRQSKTVGNLENIGYAKHGFEGLYNVYIMDETHTILACGASAVTKLKDTVSGQIQRIFNFKYPYEYISGYDSLISRKQGVGEFYAKYFESDKSCS